MTTTQPRKAFKVTIQSIIYAGDQQQADRLFRQLVVTESARIEALGYVHSGGKILHYAPPPRGMATVSIRSKPIITNYTYGTGKHDFPVEVVVALPPGSEASPICLEHFGGIRFWRELQKLPAGSMVWGSDEWRPVEEMAKEFPARESFSLRFDSGIWTSPPQPHLGSANDATQANQHDCTLRVDADRSVLPGT